MYKFLIFSLLCFLSLSFLYSHEGHKEMEKTKQMTENMHPAGNQSTDQQSGGRPLTWTQWIGSFHLIFLHFPIALINMLAISECLFIWSRRPIFGFSSKFLLVSAAIASPITAVLGFIYSYSAPYSGLMETLLVWHMWLGIGTAILTIVVAFMREKIGLSKLYYVLLIILVFILNAAGFFGGSVTFGPFHMYPPIDM